MAPKRSAAINALFEAFTQNASRDQQMDLDNENEEISDEQYQQYVAQRKEFVTQARRETVAEHFPSKDPSGLTRGEWDSINDNINARFRELLVSAFPDNHYKLNSLYIIKKQSAEKPP